MATPSSTGVQRDRQTMQYQPEVNNYIVLEKPHNCNRADTITQNGWYVIAKVIQYSNVLKYNNQRSLAECWPRGHIQVRWQTSYTGEVGDLIYRWGGSPEKSDTGVIEMRLSYLETTHTPKIQLERATITRRVIVRSIIDTSENSGLTAKIRNRPMSINWNRIHNLRNI